MNEYLVLMINNIANNKTDTISSSLTIDYLYYLQENHITIYGHQF
jgi:hypothetical protein